MQMTTELLENPLPLHTRIADFEVRDNELVIGGKTVSELASQMGDGPFYVYDSDLIKSRIAHMRQHLPDALHLHYAIKANPMPEVVNLIAPLVDGLDIASVLELDVALDSGTSPTDISFAGPGKRPVELEKAVAAGITVTIESETEMKRLIEVGEKLDCRPRVAIRVNPDFELKTSGMKMSGGPKQFGVDAEQVPDLLQKIAGSNLHLVGIHIFCGSQNLKVDALIDVQNKTYELAEALMRDIDHELEWLNLGGGFGIPYFKGDTPLDIRPLGDNLEVIVERLAAFSPSTQLMLELGRYIIGEAGVYVCQIVDRKISRGEVFLVADGGLHHHLAASGNFGQIIRKNYPVLIANKVFSDAPEKQSVVGPLCTPLDLLADKMMMSRGEIGDYVAVFQSGAYGPTASPINFLSHPLPREILV
ncbi:MAG: pyridoxal-dependent decarboxylase, exosortase A system-associated [Pseudomonadota bacterium]